MSKRNERIKEICLALEVLYKHSKELEEKISKMEENEGFDIIEEISKTEGLIQEVEQELENLEYCTDEDMMMEDFIDQMKH